MQKLLAVLIIVTFFITNCNKSPNACSASAEPPSFFFQLKRNGIPLSSRILEGVSISYMSNNIKKYITDIRVSTDTITSARGIIGSRGIGTFENQNLFIEYANNYTSDTFNIQNMIPSLLNNCQYKIKSVSFNGQIIQGDTTFPNYYNEPVYIFNKQ